jgi:mannose-6-phosphate isomerase-like protein (cupin superfamily)
MENRTILFFAGSLLLGWSIISCCQNQQNNNTAQPDAKKTVEVVLKDYGAEPTVLDIDAYTMANDNFRTAFWTGTKFQITLMSIPVGCDIGLEQHLETDQFLRIEDGQAKVMMGDSKESLTFIQMAEKDFAIIVPAGQWHNITNIGNKPLKLYSIYSPAEHPHSTLHKTQEEAKHQH